MEARGGRSSGSWGFAPSEADLSDVLAAYAGILTALGLGFLLSERYLFGLTAVFLVISVGALAFRYRERRGPAPAILGLVGAALVLFGKFKFESTSAMYAGLCVLIASSLWNSWPRREAGNELVQLTVKGR